MLLLLALMVISLLTLKRSWRGRRVFAGGVNRREFDSVNWRRGFYRIWLLLNVLWLLVWSTIAVGATWQQTAFEKRVAAARAEAHGKDPDLGLEPALDWNGYPCKSDWFERNAPGITDPCSPNPPGPYSRTELVGFWSAIVLVPLFAYGLLRVAGWVFGGFRRDRKWNMQIRCPVCEQMITLDGTTNGRGELIFPWHIREIWKRCEGSYRPLNVARRPVLRGFRRQA